MISCLMVTQEKKFELAKQAIQDFHRQTFTQRELVIVHDGCDAFHENLTEVVNAYAGDDINLYREPRTASLGELRNISVEKSSYPLICQWDDDDRYHPQRLQAQYDTLNEEDSDFCLLTDQLHWFKDQNHFYWDDWTVEERPMDLIQGTVLGKKALLGTYPSLGRGEDTPVIVDIAERGCKIARLANHGFLYIYTYNGDNVWGRDHHAAISDWKRFRWQRLEENREALVAYLSGYDFDFDVVLMPHDDGVLKIPIRD